MNTLKKYTILLCLVFGATQIMAQNQKTDTIQFEVDGVCQMCKKRIEDAVMYQKGVKVADWHASTGMVTVIYRKDKLTEADIHQAIANTGHSTDQVKADRERYNELPECCRYDDGVHKH